MDFLYEFTASIAALNLIVMPRKKVTATKTESNLDIVPSCSKMSCNKKRKIYWIIRCLLECTNKDGPI